MNLEIPDYIKMEEKLYFDPEFFIEGDEYFLANHNVKCILKKYSEKCLHFEPDPDDSDDVIMYSICVMDHLNVISTPIEYTTLMGLTAYSHNPRYDRFMYRIGDDANDLVTHKRIFTDVLLEPNIIVFNDTFGPLIPDLDRDRKHVSLKSIGGTDQRCLICDIDQFYHYCDHVKRITYDNGHANFVDIDILTLIKESDVFDCEKYNKETLLIFDKDNKYYLKEANTGMNIKSIWATDKRFVTSDVSKVKKLILPSMRKFNRSDILSGKEYVS